MDKETAALTVKSIATGVGGVALTMGVTGWAIAAAAAILGAVASLHFEQPAAGSKVWRVALQVFAMAVLGVFLGVAIPLAPLFSWTEAAPVPVRCGLLAFFANPISNLIRAFIARKTQGG